MFATDNFFPKERVRHGLFLLLSVAAFILAGCGTPQSNLDGGEFLVTRGEDERATIRFERAIRQVGDRRDEERDEILADAYLGLSGIYERRGNLRLSREYLELAALYGDGKARSAILQLHSDGLNIPGDFDAFLSIYEDLSLNEDSVRASLLLAELAGRGELAGRAHPDPVFWYRRAADLGSVSGANALIDIYADRGRIDEAAAIIRRLRGNRAGDEFYSRGKDALLGEERSVDIGEAVQWLNLAYQTVPERVERLAVNYYEEDHSTAAKAAILPFVRRAIENDTGSAISVAIRGYEGEAPASQRAALFQSLRKRATRTGDPRVVAFLAETLMGDSDAINDEVFALIAPGARRGDERAIHILAEGPADPPLLSAVNRRQRDELLRAAADNGNGRAALYTARRIGGDKSMLSEEGVRYYAIAATAGIEAGARALAGDPDAIDGLPDEQRRQVLALLDTAAENGSGSAALYMALRRSDGGEKLDTQSIRLFSLAADAGVQRAADTLIANPEAIDSLDERLQRDALSIIEKDANGGDGSSALFLALRRSDGGKDLDAEAIRLLTIAIEADINSAMRALTENVDAIDGLPEEQREAVLALIETSANEGNGSSALFLALRASGAGRRLDGESIRLFTIAAKAQNQQAIDILKMRAAFLEKDSDLAKLAIASLSEAAEAGAAEAALALGQFYQNGGPVEQDDALAFRWFMLAADAGNTEAQFRVGVLLAEGTGTERDVAGARVYLGRAAASGSIGAAAYLRSLEGK